MQLTGYYVLIILEQFNNLCTHCFGVVVFLKMCVQLSTSQHLRRYTTLNYVSITHFNFIKKLVDMDNAKTQNGKDNVDFVFTHCSSVNSI